MTLRTFSAEVYSTKAFAPLYYYKEFILSQELEPFVFALIESYKVPASPFLHLVNGHLDSSPSLRESMAPHSVVYLRTR